MFSFFKSKKNSEEIVESKTLETDESDSEQQNATGFADRLRQGLTRTRQSLGKQLSALFGGGKIDEAFYEELETILLTSDVGVNATQLLLDNLRKHVKRDALTESSQLKLALKDSLVAMLKPLEQSFDTNAQKPFVIMITGVNGVGRLTTQSHLMEEIKKVKRVIAKAMPDAPHEVLLVLDANTGQNAIAQVKAFDEALNVTGLVLTKLDGTAKGGVVAAIVGQYAQNNPPALRFIGVGEGIDDLRPFNAQEFVDAMFD